MDAITIRLSNAATAAAQAGAALGTKNLNAFSHTLGEVAQRVFTGSSEVYSLLADRARSVTRVQAGVALVVVAVIGATLFVVIKRYQRSQPLAQPARQHAERGENRFRAVRNREPTDAQKAEQEEQRVERSRQKNAKKKARKQAKKGTQPQPEATPAADKVKTTAPLKGRLCDPDNLQGIDAQIINSLMDIDASPAFLCINPRNRQLLVRTTDSKGRLNLTALFRIHFEKPVLDRPRVTAVESDWKGRPKNERFDQRTGKAIEITDFGQDKLLIQHVLSGLFNLSIQTEARRLQVTGQHQ